MIEQLIQLIKTPFEILDTVSGEKATGYGILMIIFSAAIVVAFYMFLEFVYKVYNATLKFLHAGFTSFTEMFKRNPTPQQNIKGEIESAMEYRYNLIVDRIDKNNKTNLDTLNKILIENKKGNRPTFS